MSHLEIYDCTLREGEQAAGASFSLEDRVKLFQLLDEFGVDYIELGWPLASREIFESFELCKKIRKNAKIVAFGSTSISPDVENDRNLKSIIESGSEYACIFGKSWKDQVEKQLRITPEDNLKRIEESIRFLKKNGVRVFYDAEHYFDGFKDDRIYALETLKVAINAGAEKIILCDTNGGAMPEEVEEVVRLTNNRFFGAQLGLHLHNDKGLALANTLVSLPYVTQVQGTINGMGERVGNLDFSSFLPILELKYQNKKINLMNLKKVHDETCRLSGIETQGSKPFVGKTAFAHKGGVHIDATVKGASYNHSLPQAFGNTQIILLNTLGGGSGIISAAEQFGYRLNKKDPEVQRTTERLFEELHEMENRGYRIGANTAEHFILIEKYFGVWKEFFIMNPWEITTRKNNGKEESEITAEYNLNGECVEDKSRVEGGPVDVAYKSMKKILGGKYPGLEELKLKDYHVSLARRNAEASSVRTAILFSDGEEFETVGVDSNVIQSAIEALTKGFNYYLNKRLKGQ